MTAELPKSNAGRCTQCGDWLFYRRVDHRVGVLQHFFYCTGCLRKYAARDAGWTPGASTSETRPGSL